MQIVTAVILVAVGLCLSLLLFACGAGGDPSGQVQIRVRNDAGQKMTDFWLGAGGQGPVPSAYGSIDAGATTGYQSFEPVLARYRKSNFILADGTKYVDVVYPEKHVGAKELAPGKYTFAYAVRGGNPVLTLTRD